MNMVLFPATYVSGNQDDQDTLGFDKSRQTVNSQPQMHRLQPTTAQELMLLEAMKKVTYLLTQKNGQNHAVKI